MFNEDENEITEEVGSDELLAADELRLPASANMLVRLHAMRAWLQRRHAETDLEVGQAALSLQMAMSATEAETRPRRRFAQSANQAQHAQEMLSKAQQRLSAYEEASALLEDLLAHTTASERLLVEYYLALEEMIQAADAPDGSPWLEVMLDVMQRVEQVGTPDEDGE